MKRPCTHCVRARAKSGRLTRFEPVYNTGIATNLSRARSECSCSIHVENPVSHIRLHKGRMVSMRSQAAATACAYGSGPHREGGLRGRNRPKRLLSLNFSTEFYKRFRSPFSVCIITRQNQLQKRLIPIFTTYGKNIK